MSLTLYKRGEIWHFRGTVAGRRLRGSCRTADKATAQRVAAERETQEWKGRLDGPSAVLTFAKAALLYRSGGHSDRFLDRIEDYWKDRLVRDITAGAVRQAAMALYPQASAATRNRCVIVPTQAVINNAARFDYCSRLSVERFPVARREKQPATWAWVQAFMRVAPPHLGALAGFMFLTGARISEALAVTWDDVDFSTARVKIRQSKLYGEERMAHLPPPLVVAMANCRRDRPNVFRYVSRGAASKSWDSVIERAKLPHLSPHACRHGFATAMLHAGVDPVTTAKRGGWKDTHQLFKTYGHALDDETVTDRLIGTNLTQPAKTAAKS